MKKRILVPFKAERIEEVKSSIDTLSDCAQIYSPKIDKILNVLSFDVEIEDFRESEQFTELFKESSNEKRSKEKTK